MRQVLRYWALALLFILPIVVVGVGWVAYQKLTGPSCVIEPGTLGCEKHY
jgi:hypothetical protein